MLEKKKTRREGNAPCRPEKLERNYAWPVLRPSCSFNRVRLFHVECGEKGFKSSRLTFQVQSHNYRCLLAATIIVVTLVNRLVAMTMSC